MKKKRRWATWLLVGVLVASLSGCDTAVAEAVGGSGDEEMLPEVAVMIDAQLPVIEEYVGEDLGDSAAKGLDGVTGTQVVEGTLQEDNGMAYLRFSWEVDRSGASSDSDRVVESARDVLDDAQYAALQDGIERRKALLEEQGEAFAKDLAPSKRRAFNRDLQKLVVKSTVLFTCGVVYACIPHAVWWGKIAAAAAVAVAAGVVAATYMTLMRYYKYGGTKEEAFGEWLESVTTDPREDVALATSIISLGTTLKRSPVLTGIIICVFGLYNLTDDLKPLLRKYRSQVPVRTRVLWAC